MLVARLPLFFQYTQLDLAVINGFFEALRALGLTRVSQRLSVFAWLEIRIYAEIPCIL